jgi:hypothetical protein
MEMQITSNIKTGLTWIGKSDIVYCTFESRFVREDDERDRQPQQKLVVVEQLEGGV